MSDSAGPQAGMPTGGWRALFSPHQIRLLSGLILFTYVSGHLTNHALGLISLEVMESVGEGFKSFWRFAPINILLYLAVFAHVLTAFWQVYQRRSLRMRMQEWVQLISGIAIPLLLVVHVTGTRVAAAKYGLNDTYAYVLFSTFVASPASGVINAAGLVAAWTHGCIGMHYWLRFKPFYSHRVRNISLVCATLLPVLALTGYLSAGRTIFPLASDGEWLEQYYAKLGIVDDEIWGLIGQDIESNRMVIIAAIAFVFAGRLVRQALQSRSANLTIRYVDGPDIKQARGATLLDISRSHGLPHASICGGRGRCSTCRVRILEAATPPTAPEAGEMRVLQRIKAPQDVRLACQLVPQSDMRVVRLLPPDTTLRNSADLSRHASGREQQITVLFVDLRGFTKAAESRLPFDVVYLINQFTQSMGNVVARNGGMVDKFLGDGVMALFGVDDSQGNQAANALKAAADMMRETENLNERLRTELPEKFRIGVGIHSGSAILGEIGFGASRSLTAIGDTVNTASRLESATKVLGCTLCVSAQTLDQAGVKSKTQAQTINVPGRTAEISVFAFNTPDELPLLPSKANGRNGNKP